MPKIHASKAIEDRANAVIHKLTKFKINFNQSDFNIFTYHSLNDEASAVKKELIEKIYYLADLIAKGSEISLEEADGLRDASVIKGDALIKTVRLRHQKLQDERICRRIGLVMLHANITNSIHEIESRLYEELTVINQMEDTVLASQC